MYAGLLIVGVYAGLLIVGVCLIVNGGQKLIGYYLFLISLEGCTKRSVRNRGRSPRCISAKSAVWKTVPCTYVQKREDESVLLSLSRR